MQHEFEKRAGSFAHYPAHSGVGYVVAGRRKQISVRDKRHKNLLVRSLVHGEAVWLWLNFCRAANAPQSIRQE